MLDFKELFYASQAEIADTLEQLQDTENRLRFFLQSCEEQVITKNITMTVNNNKNDRDQTRSFF